MQIDFHHTVTYVIARLAGFSQTEAGVIAYSAQYVDDAVNSGTVAFRSKAMYNRISSAHRMLDYRNFEDLGNHLVWIPFHFLPGNQGRAAGENPDASFVEKIVCLPDSHVAQDMVRTCIRDHAKPYALHRLGICMHVYADTWAHQNFAGINHEINRVKDMTTRGGKKDKGWLDWVRDYFGDKVDEVTGELVSGALPLGHGAVLSKPDMPFLEEWSYTNGVGQIIKRKNFQEFTEAAQAIFRAMKNFQLQDPQLGSTAKIPAADLKKTRSNFKKFTNEDGDERHERWLNSIAAGDFSFGAEELTYIAKGRNSWKYHALDTTKEIENGKERYRFKPEFLHSNWKLFHDALQAHRFDVLHDILPRYGISAA